MRRIYFIFGLVLMLVIAGCTTDAEKTAKKKAKESSGIKTPGSAAKVKPCEDTDANNDIFKRGVITLFNQNEMAIEIAGNRETVDTCNGNKVIQYDCPAAGVTIDKNTVLPSIESNCANGCRDGMCLRQPLVGVCTITNEQVRIELSMAGEYASGVIGEGETFVYGDTSVRVMDITQEVSTCTEAERSCTVTNEEVRIEVPLINGRQSNLMGVMREGEALGFSDDSVRVTVIDISEDVSQCNFN